MKRALAYVAAFSLGFAAAALTRPSRTPAPDLTGYVEVVSHGRAGTSPPRLRPYLVITDGRRERVRPEPVGPDPLDVWQVNLAGGRVALVCTPVVTR